MAAKRNLIVALDIGTSKVAVVVAEPQTDGQLEIIGVGKAISRGLRKGVVINIEATVHSIAEAISQAETMSGLSISKVFAGIGGAHLQSMNSHGIVGIKSKEISNTDISNVIDAARAVAIPVDREVLHVLPQHFIVDEQDGIFDPLGMSGVRLEAKVHMITGSIASSQNIVKSANRAGVTIEDLTVNALACAEAVLSDEEKELGVCLLDIGGGTTDLIAFKDGAVQHLSVIPIGGNHITNDIAVGLRTPVLAAESLKCQHGVAQSSLVKGGASIQVESTGGRSSRAVYRQKLAEIIEARVEEILSLAFESLDKSGLSGITTSGVVITGGSAALEGIDLSAEKIFSAPARVANVTPQAGLYELVQMGDFASAVGLARIVHNGQYLPLSSKGGGWGELFKRANTWIFG